MTLAIGAYFFCIALILAHLEIQIEGPHGWAEKLPTWRWDSPRIRRWFGKPVTGYHLCLVTFILLFLHLPQFYGGSWDREADLLAMFFFLTVTWDFLWFACNRHFGVARFRKGQIWWFPAWTLGVPQPYLLVIALSFCVCPRAGPLDGGVGGARPGLEHRLRRAARADGRRDVVHASPRRRALPREITGPVEIKPK